MPASGVVLRSARLSTIAQQPVYFRFTCNETALVAEGGDAVVGGGGADVVAEGGADVVAEGGADVVAEEGDALVAEGGADIVAEEGADVVAGGGANVVAGEGDAVVAGAASNTPTDALGGSDAGNNKAIQNPPDWTERFGGPFCVHC